MVAAMLSTFSVCLLSSKWFFIVLLAPLTWENPPVSYSYSLFIYLYSTNLLAVMFRFLKHFINKDCVGRICLSQVTGGSPNWQAWVKLEEATKAECQIQHVIISAKNMLTTPHINSLSHSPLARGCCPSLKPYFIDFLFDKKSLIYTHSRYSVFSFKILGFRHLKYILSLFKWFKEYDLLLCKLQLSTVLHFDF